MMINFEELRAFVDELIKTRLRAETEYAQNLFVYAKCPNGIGTKIEAYGRLWLLAGILGYSADKVMQDIQKAEKEG